MMHRKSVFASAASVLAGGALLLATGGASAQIDDLGGRVTHIDTWARTVAFADGRIVHYDPQWRVLVNGREVAMTDVQPGAVVAVVPSSTSTTAVVPGASQPAMAQGHPRSSTTTTTSAPAVVTSIDRTTQTITLDDGRVVKVTEVQVWRQDVLEELRPGSRVYVPSGTTAMVPSTGSTVVTATPPTATTVAPGTAADTRMTTGRVRSISTSGSEVVLADGRTVILSPSTTVQTVNARTVTIDELRPGDPVTIQVEQVVPVAGLDATAHGAHAGTSESDRHDSAVLPSYRYPGSSVVAADRAVIVRYPEAL
jgi:hypothetical protein